MTSFFLNLGNLKKIICCIWNFVRLTGGILKNQYKMKIVTVCSNYSLNIPLNYVKIQKGYCFQ